ncbi:hypothetical protein BBO99_00000815 [Phytophthora kernoviae]|uniref:THIF-type NAD/FAD binding fold domain-containing protein n=1 Tax=Phytophthora kernoviae TaxID=325452 RepID=A0A3R7H2Q7_9STRA|nr:hypothetical protein JM16_000640 [Phytophthora kernoviae]KAG2532701.1 hypothetical protein JM18_000722 [Phytophthora kernoviae]RLN44391.1 hypothetical protein BBI17_001005 [Phytophthora kernoviae]RLN85059.1 hypothetical protein BBO99_00000815 [Phytophthora kernoviae]
MVKTVGGGALAAAFGVGVATALLVQWAYQTSLKKQKTNLRAPTVEKSLHGTDAAAQELLQEQLSRIASFFGPEGFAKVQDAFVVVVGLGGVGSHAAHMLARSGVGKLRLIDFDNVTLSSLNRHAVATRADVGLSKVTAMKRHLLEIVPDCEVEDLNVMFQADSAEELLEGKPTYVLDCIDDVKTKLSLLETAIRLKLKIITATGAGAKADPTRLQIGTLKDTVRDPLATKIRYFLKKKKIDSSKITTIFSSEKSVCKLLPLDAEQAANPDEFGNVENFRIRVIPVLGTMPALFGQSMAAYVLCDLAGKKLNPEAVARLSRDQRNKLHQKLQQREYDLFHEGHKIAMEKDEIEFIYQEIWRGRSAASGVRNDGHQRLYLSRWRKELPLLPDNVVYLTTKELDVLDKAGVEGFDPEVVAQIDARLKQFGSWE